METIEFLRTLTEARGPSGFEGTVAKIVADRWQPLVDELSLDRVGSLVAIKKGTEPRAERSILLAAHIDEIGLMVREITRNDDGPQADGFLGIINLGGIDIRQLIGQLVTVHGRREVAGVIASLPTSMIPDFNAADSPGYDQLVVDPGLDYEELIKIVSVGDVISFEQPFTELKGGKVSGKALDNRASVAAITCCLNELQGRAHSWDVVAVATAQEEVNLLGAHTSAYASEPDVAIAVDVTFGLGPGVTGADGQKIGRGPAVAIGAAIHPGVRKKLAEAARKLEMEIQSEPIAGRSGTDADAIQLSRSGVPTGLVSIPLRYMHTLTEVVSIADVERTGRLLAQFISMLDAKFLDMLAAEMMGEELKDE